MAYIGAGISRFNTADGLTVTGTSDLKDNVAVTGNVTTTGTVEPAGDTAAGDNAAIGFTSTEGLILTGQGSTSDVVIKNDADTTVCFVPTGTDDLKFNDNAAILMGTGSDMQIIHDGSNSIISDNGTGNLVLRSDSTAVEIDFNTAETAALFNHNGSVELYHDNSKKFETTSTGIDVTGNAVFDDTAEIQMGAGADLKIFSDGTNGALRANNGRIFLQSDTGINLTKNGNAETMAILTPDGSVELYHDNTKRIETSSTGVGVTGSVIATGLVEAEGGNAPSGGFQIKDTGGTARPRITNDASNATVIRAGSASGNVKFNNFANTSELVHITDSGTVGIGVVPSGTAKLQVNGQIYASSDGTASAPAFAVNDGDTGMFRPLNNNLAFTTNGSERLRITNNGYLQSPPTYTNVTAAAANVHIEASVGQFYRSTSSRRYKNTINDATHGLTELLALRPVTYKGNNDGDTVFGGLIAEEVHDSGLTEFVQYNDDNEPDALSYGNMVSLCIKAIQEQQTTITKLEARIAALEAAE